MNITNEDYKKKLSPEAYSVCCENGTEAPFSGKYYNHKEDGVYKCVCCDTPLFSSKAKFDSGTGWPSFFECEKDAIKEIEDDSFGMMRIEVRCKKCDSHLGHLFPDGSASTHLRYCINSVCLNFEKE